MVNKSGSLKQYNKNQCKIQDQTRHSEQQICEGTLGKEGDTCIIRNYFSKNTVIHR